MKTSSKNVLGVIEQSLKKKPETAFFTKFSDDENYYIIILLHLHKFIGVEPKKDGNYNFSLIYQTKKDYNYFISMENK